MRRVGGRTTWIVAVLGAMACSGGEPSRNVSADSAAAPPPPADAVVGASWSRDGTRLAATWLRGGRERIYGLFGPVADSILPTPSRGLPITAGQGSDPTWSPDGLWVAYATTRAGNPEIYRARPDGTGPQNLTGNPAADGEPAYSPDGRLIAFTSDRGGSGPRVYLMNADGSHPRPLGGGLPDDDQRAPRWSPDGRAIACTVGQGADASIWVDTLSGGGAGRIGPGEGPAWSSDGASLFYTRHDSIFEQRTKGGGDAVLVVANARAPSPSPRGHWLAFVRGGADASALYLLDLRSKAETRITS